MTIDLKALRAVADGLDEDNFATDAKLVRAAADELERLYAAKTYEDGYSDGQRDMIDGGGP